jgi:hypothetical protein
MIFLLVVTALLAQQDLVACFCDCLRFGAAYGVKERIG